jgi:hypothetical protein
MDRTAYGTRIALNQSGERVNAMEAVVVTAALLGSFATAWAIQKTALEALFRVMAPNRRERE